MNKDHVINWQGTDFVKYEGLLDEAHRQGLKRITTTLLQIPSPDNQNTAIVQAEVETEKGVFSGLGDANPTNVGRNIVPHILRMAECVPVRAQILTWAGWRYHDEVAIGDRVLAYNPASGETEWVALRDKQVFAQQPTVRLFSRSFDATCTPNHRWVTRRGLRPLNEFGAGESILVAAPGPEDSDSNITDQEAAILGWLATDGSIRSFMTGTNGPYTRAVIRQSKPSYVEELTALTAGLASHRVNPSRQRDFGTYVSDCLPQHDFDLAAPFVRALLHKTGLREWSDLPQIVPVLSRSARAAMLDAMLKGDGTQNDRGRWVFGKKRKPGVMEAFEILATLQGVALGSLYKSSVGDVPLRTLRKNRHVTAAYLRREDAGLQDVWCPTTRYGTWVMRLDGTISITGNTRAKARALRDAVNIGATALEELGDFSDSEGDGYGGSGAESSYRSDFPRASSTKAASANQLATIAKLSRLLGEPEEPSEDMTSAQASDRITELSREYNLRKGAPARRSS